MRILHVLSQTQLTGAESYAQQLAEEQRRSGHEVFFASDDLYLQKPTGFLSMPVHYAKGLQFYRSKFQLRNFLKDSRIDVIHAHSRAAARLSWASRGHLKIGMLTTFHGIHPASWSKRMRNIYGERSIAVCEGLKQWCVNELWMDANSIAVVGNPFPIPLKLQTHQSQVSRAVYVSRPTGPKGQRLRDFLRTHATTLLKTFPLARLEVYGVESADLQNIHLDSRVQIKGHYKNSEEVLRGTQLIIGGGRVAIEGILNGIPTISLGEYKFEGLATPQNFSQQLFTNFGDTGNGYLPYDERDFRNSLEGLKTISAADLITLSQQASRLFSSAEVHRKVLRNYQLACFKRQHSKNIPVLMYHKVPDQDIDSQHRIFINKERFDQHMGWLAQKKFTALTFAEIKNFLEFKTSYSEFPKKPILLTFDDGYRDNLRNAGPILKKHGMKATLFLLADTSLEGNSWDAYEGDTSNELMTAEERQELAQNFPFEIGSHGLNHKRLTDMSLSEASAEMSQAKAKLEKEFQRDIISFAYPFGDRNDALGDLCEQNGYDFAVNTDRGGLYVLDNPFSIFRVNIFPEDKLPQLRKKSSWWYRRYFYIKKKK